MIKRKWLWISCAALGVIAICAGVIVFKAGTILDYLCKQRTSIATVDAHNQRRIILTADTCWEDTRPIYYEVTQAGRITTPTTYIGNDDGNQSHEYKVFFAENEALVAVVESTATPPEIIVMQDFNSGASWPRFLGEYSWDKSEFAKRKSQELFDRLQRENPQLPKRESVNR